MSNCLHQIERVIKTTARNYGLCEQMVADVLERSRAKKSRTQICGSQRTCSANAQHYTQLKQA